MYKYKLSNSDLVTITSGGASVRSRLRASLRRTALSRDKDGSKHSKPPLLEPPKVHFHFHKVDSCSIPVGLVATTEHRHV